MAFIASAGAATPVLAQTSVPVHREPRHRLVWEEGHVRVLDVQITPGDTTLFHTHDTAILYVPIAISPISTQAMGGAWSGATAQTVNRFRLDATASDTTYVNRALTHRVANIGTGLFRLIAVTNAHASGASAARSDSIPGTLERNSTWYLQTRLALTPRSTSAWYTSPVPVVIVHPAAGRIAVEGAVASASPVLDGAGSWVYIRPNERFRLRNDGAEAHTVVIVQVK